MANVDSAQGLKPVRMIDGSPWNGAVSLYYVPATDNTVTYIGAPIKLAGDADADGVPTATTCTASGDLCVGAVVSVIPTQASDPVYRLASTARYILVADAANTVFEIQCTGTLTTTMIGNSCDWSTPTTGTAATGRSLVEANLATVTATGDATEDMNILRLAPRPDNEVGADAKVWVRLLNHKHLEATPGS